MTTPDFAHMTVADALRWAAKSLLDSSEQHHKAAVQLHPENRMRGAYFEVSRELCGFAASFESAARRAEAQKARRK